MIENSYFAYFSIGKKNRLFCFVLLLLGEAIYLCVYYFLNLLDLLFCWELWFGFKSTFLGSPLTLSLCQNVFMCCWYSSSTKVKLKDHIFLGWFILLLGWFILLGRFIFLVEWFVQNAPWEAFKCRFRRWSSQHRLISLRISASNA